MKDIPSIDLSTYVGLTRNGGIAHAQPSGVWREYGATPMAMRVGVGLVPPSPPPASAVDHHGNTLWHYWAEGLRPAQRWEDWVNALSPEMVNEVNGRGEHVLHRLAIHGHAEAIQLWFKTFRWPKPKPLTNDGDSILHRAAWSGDAATIKEVLKRSKDMDVPDAEGQTALSIALHRGGLAAAEPLLKAGADPNVRDVRGRTAMHHAAEDGDPDVLERVEAFGGDRDWPDDIGRTADDLLQQRMELDARRRASAQRHWTRLFEQRKRL